MTVYASFSGRFLSMTPKCTKISVCHVIINFQKYIRTKIRDPRTPVRFEFSLTVDHNILCRIVIIICPGHLCPDSGLLSPVDSLRISGRSCRPLILTSRNLNMTLLSTQFNSNSKLNSFRTVSLYEQSVNKVSFYHDISVLSVKPVLLIKRLDTILPYYSEK